MSWLKLNDSLNKVKGQITSFAQEVLAEGVVEDQVDDDQLRNPARELNEAREKIGELTGLCATQDQEIATLRKQIAEYHQQQQRNQSKSPAEVPPQPSTSSSLSSGSKLDECGSTPPTNKKQSRISNDVRQEFLAKAIDHLDNEGRKTRDEADSYGESWAYGYRKLTNEQKLYAKKAIDDILILGQLQGLTLYTVSMDPVHQQPAVTSNPDPQMFSLEPMSGASEEPTDNCVIPSNQGITASFQNSQEASASQAMHNTQDTSVVNIAYSDIQQLLGDVQYS